MGTITFETVATTDVAVTLTTNPHPFVPTNVRGMFENCPSMDAAESRVICLPSPGRNPGAQESCNVPPSVAAPVILSAGVAFPTSMVVVALVPAM